MPLAVLNRGELRYTICGEWFPETFPKERSERWSRGDEDPLETEMRLFCACTRWAYNRVAEGWSKSDILREGR
ncbi:MAG: IS200/IS605 family accessory protein TnpB-related protein, partial [Desulfotomaculales bacterium]